LRERTAPNTNTPTARAIGQPTLDVGKILIGKRHRTEFGDISGLTDSINARGGLLQPIVVTPGHTLIAGERRIRAWSLSKFRDQPIPVTVVDVDSIVAGEWDENAQRKDFTPSEAVAIKRALEPLEKAAAAARLAHGKTAPGKKGGEVKGHGRARDKIAAVVGMDPKTIAKAEAIVDAADADPEKFGKLKEQMDRTGNVSGPHKRLTNMRQSEAIKAEPPPLPGKGPYRTGVIDWPWASEPDGQSPAETGRGYFNYPTMTTAEMIAAGPAIRAILNPDAWIWNWVTNFHLVKGHAFAVLDGVFGELPGYERVHIRTGVKDKIGRGQVLRGDTEHAILSQGRQPAGGQPDQSNDVVPVQGPQGFTKAG
jgi:ParB-like chromosome segregation protein Spo0J